MKKIWWILTVLTLARTAMGFQFQSLAVMGPTLITNSNLSYIELGTLIGIYLLPGILFAIPGGWLGKRFGDKPVVVTGLVMMTIGGSLLALADSYHHMFLGRLLSGLGAVLLNVLMTKMVTDWFAEHRLSVAMGIFITSWPLGISIALLTIGPLESMIGPEMIFFVPAILCASVLVLVATIYSNPPQSIEAEKTSIDSSKSKLTGYEFSGVVMCGLVWSLYNVALILLLSFGPEFLIAQGVTPITSGAIVSLTSWLIIPALPLGAWIAERTGNPFTTMGVTFITIAILSWMIPFTSYYLLIFILLGLVFGPAGGLIMALPAQVLRKENRAIGMGVFFTIYYAGMGIFPVIAGYARDKTDNPAAPLVLAGIIILCALLSLVCFRLIQIRHSRISTIAIY